MKPFTYSRSASVQAAVAAAEQAHDLKFLGGGTNLVDLMREDIEQPDTLLDITAVPFSEISVRSDGGLSIGAGARNSAVAAHPSVRANYPMLSEAILCGASAQIRNMATVGGNLMQRTRCLYFYDRASRCNKRHPGSGCDAIEGFTRMHAILGTSNACIAAHPSDMCVALAALDAIVHVHGPSGERSIAFTDFHRLPGKMPERDNNLQQAEIITAVELPPKGFAKNYSYLKIRDRLSYAFALVSAAVGLELDGDTIKEARFALGGVAHKPWRDPRAEAALQGQPANAATFARAADVLLRDARGYEHNSFKIDLARRCLVRALTQAARGTPQSQSSKKIA